MRESESVIRTVNMMNYSVLTVLFLAANPIDSSPSRLEQEARDINEGLLRARHREVFTFEQKWAVRAREVQQALLDYSPQIVHFSGNRRSDSSNFDNNKADSFQGGLAFEDSNGKVKWVSAEAIAGLFELFSDKVNCVLLNGCNTAEQAAAIAQHIPYAIGTKQHVTDSAALTFALGFYDALGAGHSVEFAYQLGCISIRMEGLPEHMMPVLFKRAEQMPQSDTDTVADCVIPIKSMHHKSKDRRLKGKIEDLEEEYQATREKLRFLKQELVIKNDAEAKYELSQRVEQYETKLRDIEDKLEALEKRSL